MRLKTDKEVRPPRASKHWTPREEERLLELTKRGRSVRQIAKELGRRHQAVCSKLDRMSLGKRSKARNISLPETRSEDLAAVLRARGWTCISPEEHTEPASGVVLL